MPLFWFESFPFVTELSETNAGAFPKWVEEPSPPFARVRLRILPQGPGKSLRRPSCPRRANSAEKQKSGGGWGGEGWRQGWEEKRLWGSRPPSPPLLLPYRVLKGVA